MVRPTRTPLSGLVEIDETQILYRTKDDPGAGRGGRAPEGKMQVVVAVEVIDDAPGSTLKTGGWSAYPGVAGFTHESHVIGSGCSRHPAEGPSGHRQPQDLGFGGYLGLRRERLEARLDEFVICFNRRRTPHAALRSLLAIGLASKPVTDSMLIAAEAMG